MSRFSSRTHLPVVLTLLSGLSGVTSGCQARGTDNAVTYEQPVQIERQQRVSYSFLKTNYLEPKCIRCHAEYRTEAGLLRDVVPGEPQKSSLYKEVEEARMPPGASKPPAATLDLLSQYIIGLKVENQPPAPSPTPSSIPSPVVHITFAVLKQRVLEPSCLACHEDMATETGLTPYVKPGDPEHSSLYLSIIKGRMPPDSPLPAEQSNLVRDYISGWVLPTP